MNVPSSKHLSFDNRLYNKIKSKFVENVDPRQLMFYLPMRPPDEQQVLDVYDSQGRIEAAGMLLRSLLQRPDWCDSLITALSNPQISMGFLAEEIERHRRELVVVVEMEIEEEDRDEQTNKDHEPMDIDTVEDGFPSPMSDQSRFAKFKDIAAMAIKELPVNQSQFSEVLRHFSEINNVLFTGYGFGCLELHFRVLSLHSLYVLRDLYQGGALCDALTRGILTPAMRERIQREAAKQGLRFKNIHLTVRISEEDFLECERLLSYDDTPPPRGYLAAKTSPVEPFSDHKDPSIQQHLDNLPLTYQQFVKSVADLTVDPSGTLTLAKKAVCTMVKECMELLHECLKTDDIVQKDLIKIGLNLLAKAAVHKKKNVNTICVQNGGKNELVWDKEEKEFLMEQKTISDEFRDGVLASPIDKLVSDGWLVEVVDRVASVGKTRYYVNLSLRRDYIVCFLLPTKLQKLNFKLFLNTNDNLDNSTELFLFHYAGIILPYVSCYHGIVTSFPDKALYFPDVALLLSSVHAHEESEEVKEHLEDMLEQFEFQSFLTIQTSPEVDKHWKTWKTVAANFGCDHLEMVNSTNLDQSAFENKISGIEDTLKVEHGNVIPLASKSSDFDLKLALRSVALLDLLPSVTEEPSFVQTKESPQQPADPAKSPLDPSKTQGAGPSPTTSVPPAVSTGQRSSFHEPLSQRYSGSSEQEQEMLRKQGCLSLDSEKVKSDYNLRRPTDWSFSLDMSKYYLTKKQVSLLCGFLPQFDHVTRYSFNSASLGSSMVKQIVHALNPQTVKGLSFVGCTLELGAGLVGFDRMTRLEFLDLEDTGISDMDCKGLVKEINCLKSLKEINVGCNEITHFGFSVLASALISKVNLRALRVHASKLGEAGAAVLSQLVYTWRHLEILSIWGCGLGDEGVHLLSEQFKIHKKLKRLSIRDNNMSFIGSTQLYRNLSSCKYMQFLDTNENTSLNLEEVEYVSTNLVNMLSASSSWDHVSFWNCNIGQLTIFDESSNFKTLSGITYLCLQKNGLSDDSIRPLSNCIEKHFSFLQHLNLRENLVGDEGARCLARALADKIYLEDLWLDWNIFGHDGAKALIKRALELPDMKSVDLSFSFQLSPPERELLATMVGEPVPDGDFCQAQRGQLSLRI